MADDRATVALVSAQIGELRAIVEGHVKLTEHGFTDLQRQLDSVSQLPVVVNGMIERMKAWEDRVEDIEDELEKRRDWKVSALPPMLLTLLGIVVTVISLFVVKGGTP